MCLRCSSAGHVVILFPQVSLRNSRPKQMCLSSSPWSFSPAQLFTLPSTSPRWVRHKTNTCNAHTHRDHMGTGEVENMKEKKYVYTYICVCMCVCAICAISHDWLVVHPIACQVFLIFVYLCPPAGLRSLDSKLSNLHAASSSTGQRFDDGGRHHLLSAGCKLILSSLNNTGYAVTACCQLCEVQPTLKKN